MAAPTCVGTDVQAEQLQDDFHHHAAVPPVGSRCQHVGHHLCQRVVGAPWAELCAPAHAAGKPHALATGTQKASAGAAGKPAVPKVPRPGAHHLWVGCDPRLLLPLLQLSIQVCMCQRWKTFGTCRLA